MVIENKKTHLNNIESIFISTTSSVSFSSLEISKLLDKGVTIFFTDKKHAPYASIGLIFGSFDASSRINFQFKWNRKRKESLVQKIIENKIHNQEHLLLSLNMCHSNCLTKYLEAYEGLDKNNVEGVVAKQYFRFLFGKDFCRDDNCVINQKLNYGYALLAAEISRLIVSKGYVTQIGIKHKSSTNKFNLTYDFIEPFRPFVDEYVCDNKNTSFNFKEKCQMHEIFEKEIMLNNKKYELKDAINEYVSNCVIYLNNNFETYLEVSF